ncbi:MAG: hypothetical protein HGB12_08515 [Bacteroidetes bacterium]|nr:hypothetical protein [Bacteroidota bacterium]
MTLTQQSLSNQQTFSYTAPGGEQSFTVPAGITCIKIEAWGAQGGIGYSSGYAAGLGGYVAGNTTVAPNDVLKVYVGGKGADATTLGGGIGGYNGGGTGAYNNSNYNGGGGGGASDVRYGGTTLSYRIIVGGAGGGSSGYSSSGGTGGAGGSTASGALGIGGNSSACGGAGGGGYNGGVGGTSCGSSGGGGGGGSSWAGTLTSTTLTSGIRSGNGQIIIHW